MQAVLINIIKLSLWDKTFEESSLLSLSYKDWMALYQEACCQGMPAIFVNGIDKLGNKSEICRKFLQEEGVQAIVLSESRWMGQLQLAVALSSTLQKHGISMLLLKGLGLSLCYPDPKYRESGDIDIYLFGKYEEGNSIAEKELGGKIEKFSQKEDHIIFGDFQIDNHITFLWTVNKNNQEIDRYLKFLLNKGKLTKFQDTDILLPPVDFNLLFLMVHSYSHFFREGMSLRQMTDIAMFLNKHEVELDWKKNNQIFSKFRLKQFSDAIVAFITKYFGISFRYTPIVDQRALEKMMNDILGQSHIIEHHQLRLYSKIYIARNAWKNRWRYNAFYDGGFRKFVFDILKSQIGL